LDKIDGNRKI